jgi:hypothetical protein
MHVHLTSMGIMGLKDKWNLDHFTLFHSSPQYILQNLCFEVCMSKSSQVVNCVNVEFMSNISETRRLL